MKKIFLTSLLFVAVGDGLHAQIMQRKVNTSVQANSNVKTMTMQSGGKTPTAQPAQKPVTAQTVVKPLNIVPLNPLDPKYRQFVAKSNAKLPPGSLQKVVAFSKTYIYPDGSKVHVYLTNKNINSQAIKTNEVSAKTISQSSSGDDANDCTTTNISLSATSDNFMDNNYASQAPYIYPGAIYTYDNLFNGNFKEEFTGRNPIILSTDNTNISGDSYEVVAQPNQINLTNSVTKLFQRFTSVPSATGIKTFPYRIFESSNSADLNLKLGADASGYGVSFNGFVAQKKDSKTEYLTIDALKVLFTIYVAIPDSGFYNTSKGGDSHLVVISAVHYGVRVLANLRATFKSEQDEADFNAHYGGFGVSADVDFSYLSSNTSAQNTINAYYVGGQSSYTTTSFDKNQLENQITQYLANANYQTVVPVSYDIMDLNYNQMGSRTATDQFSVPLCVPKALDNAALDCSGNSNDANATYTVIQTSNNSGDNKDRDTHYSFGIFDNNGRPIAGFHDNSNNDPYDEGNTTPPLYLNSQNAAAFKDFVNGGRIHINVAPNGNDNWNITSFSIFLKFTNPSSTQKLTWNNIHLGQDRRDVDLNFGIDKTNANGLSTNGYTGGGDW
jgi:hypothetical protein